MGLQTKITRGFSQIFLDSQDFTTLLEQYGMCEKTLPNSTILTSVTESRESGGRELVESARNSIETLPPESLQNQDKVRKVESGRVSRGAGEEIPEVEYVEEISNV